MDTALHTLSIGRFQRPSRLHADNQAMLAAALPLYDALDVECQGVRGESQGWNPAAVT